MNDAGSMNALDELLRDSADFHRDQSERLAGALQDIIDIVGFEPGPPYDEPLFKSIYSVPRLLEHIRSLRADRG